MKRFLILIMIVLLGFNVKGQSEGKVVTENQEEKVRVINSQMRLDSSLYDRPVTIISKQNVNQNLTNRFQIADSVTMSHIDNSLAELSTNIGHLLADIQQKTTIKSMVLRYTIPLWFTLLFGSLIAVFACREKPIFQQIFAATFVIAILLLTVMTPIYLYFFYLGSL